MIDLTGGGLTLETARQAWASVLGPEHVITDTLELGQAATTTFPTSRSVPAILRPANRQQVQECLRIANRHRIAVYPLSSGMNWGYGSKVPPADGCVLLDLRRMNRILAFDEELAYVTVEPGVTQRQLLEFLRERKSNLWMDATGSSPECSLIGNTMERGFGHTPYGDHFANSCGLEVVLPTGEVIETGLNRFPGAKAGPLFRSGLGPSLDGLFSQSNLGIVTRMTIWLMPAPDQFEAFRFQASEEQFPEVVNALRRLRLEGTLRSAVHIGNDYKVLSSLQQYPWEEADGVTPLPRAVMERMRRTHGFEDWNGFGAFYGTKNQVREAQRLLRRALRGKVRRLGFLNDRKIEWMARLAGPVGWLTGRDVGRMLEVVKPVFDLMRGVPSGKFLESTYWRKRGSIPGVRNPDRDGCGLVWCAPTAPAEGESARELARLTSAITARHGFEPIISMTLMTERVLVCVISICYDRTAAGEDRRAMDCHDALMESFLESGYPPYRLGIQSMGVMGRHESYSRMLKKLKSALDPEGILAPGRYQATP